MTPAPTLGELASSVSLGVAGVALIALALAFADADLPDVRPALRVAHQRAVFATRDLDRVICAVRHEVAPVAVLLVHAVFVSREAARDVAALLILLTTRPQGAMA